MTIEVGGKIMEEKWGHKGCDLRKVGLNQGDQWRVERDWWVTFKLGFVYVLF